MKEKIIYAYAQLLEKKEADKITVKDIVAECHISRQTFYYYFQDIIDVNECTLQTYVDEALHRWLKTDTPQEGIEVFVDTLYEHKKILVRLGESKYILSMQMKLIHTVREMFDAVLRQKTDLSQMEKGTYETMLDFVSWGIVGCTITGLMGGEDKNVLCKIMTALLKKYPYTF